MADRMRAAIAAREFDVRGMKIPVTVSIGVASSLQLAVPNRERMIEMADAAMYRAKRGGRNRVELATDPVTADSTLAAASNGSA